jgi:hypothetical protein
MRIKFFAVTVLILMLMLMGCSNRAIYFDGESDNWKVMLTNSSETEMAEFTIRYIGDEYAVKDVHYQFSGQEFEANGYEENLGNPQRDIKHASGAKFLDLEQFPLSIHIQWNEDRAETISLEKL